MFHVFEVTNPISPTDGVERQAYESGATLGSIAGRYREDTWLCIAFLDGKRFYPLREEWDFIVMNDNDSVWFVPHVGATAFFILSALISVVSIFVSLTLTPPDVADQPEADPVFDLTGQKNQNRLGKVIEDGYGSPRLWPSYGAMPYNQYVGNDQIQLNLFCLGHGSWDVTGLFIEDTPFSDFSDIEYEIALPGEIINLFPNNVETSTEVSGSGIYMPADNEPEVGYIGPFTANSAGSEATRLEVDIVCPLGVYGIGGGDGKLNLTTIAVDFEYREVGDVTWLPFDDFTHQASTVTPLRFTLSKEVPAGRYEVRGIRTSDKSSSGKNDTYWNGLRTFFPNTEDFGDVTMLAVKARASNTLNNQSSNKINVEATRMIPVPDGEGVLPAFDDYQSRTATRSPIWAMVNILRAPYGGNFDDEFLDLDYFISEASIAESEEIYFDWIYDQSSTVWENIKLPCFVNKSTPILKGSQVSFTRDQPASLPSAFFNPENTLEGSFKLEQKLFNITDHDGAEVEYTDSTTWKPETVLCLLPGQEGYNPKKIKIQGVTDRQKAFELGSYLWFKEFNEREVVEFSTGLEGHISTYGDIVRIGSDIPRWGDSGLVKGITGNTISLSEPVSFTDGETHQIALRGKYNQDLGPYEVTEGSNEREVVSVVPLPTDQFFFDYQNEPPYYIFGVSSIVGKTCRINKLTPQGSDTVGISAIVDDQGRFADFGTAPAIGDVPVPPTIPDAPVVDGVNVTPILGNVNLSLVAWNPAIGATYYIVESSPDNVTWDARGNTTGTSLTISVAESFLYVRVAAVNLNVGPWDTWSGLVGVPTEIPGDVINLQVDPSFVGSSARVTWAAAIGATTYEVKVITNAITRITAEVSALEYTVTNEALSAVSGVDRDITFEVTAKNSIGLGANTASILASNPTPAATVGMSSFIVSETSTTRTHRISWTASVETDLSRYTVWLSDTQGFTPAPGDIIHNGTSNTVDYIQTDTGSGFVALYWRVSAVDVWGDETNISDEQEIINVFGVGSGDSFGVGGGDEFSI